MMKHDEMVIYHIFTMGYCGAEATQAECDGIHHRLNKIEAQLPYLKKLGVNTILLGPLFSSISHGYDTTDYAKVDPRLGTNEDLIHLVQACHDQGVAVILDCVFNHVGRSFFAFEDLKQNREGSIYKDWFDSVNFWDNNSYNDGFSYRNWAGCDNLVKLNLYHPDVKDYLKRTLASWIDDYDIDGVRMDAANVMDMGFVKELGDLARAKKPGFFMVGESVSGDYSLMVERGGLDSVTNYEDYKGLYSSLNDKNYFEIAYSLNRLFAQGGLYQHFLTYNFVDNHDVDRVASTLNDERDLEPLYLMLFTMPGIPTIYYGSELGIKARKGNGTDAPLRPAAVELSFDLNNPLTEKIRRMIAVHKGVDALKRGSYEQMFVQSCQMGFIRRTDNQTVVAVFNCEGSPVQIRDDRFNGLYYDLYHQKECQLSGMVTIPEKSGMVLMSMDQEIPDIQISEDQPAAEDRDNENVQIDSTSDAVFGARPKKMEDYMGLALEEAHRAEDEGEVPIGAVIVKDGEVIASNHNRKEGMQDPMAHAEMLVIQEASKKLARWRLDDCELYVTAEPCPMCMGAVIQSRIKKVVFGASEPRYGAVESTAQLKQHPMLSKHTEIYGGIRENECEAVLKRSFEKNRK
ncbi:alpha-amylase family glycosyl hydrolase [uncultured Pseudoramibacter sp.]|uniref:alpha-amylase family glycosyl hydrolase n=1 Tax=uncultured Pseudoramibacter sp. TaxID=1623493 RepID=UPI0025DB521E|nr:alpha-amylase family glycosyl hydrolase [uncultured Pseudoramibacter sp.]